MPGERAVLHERLARALQARGEESLAAEAAAHWAAAGRAAEELAARVTAAGAAERVFGYTEAAVHLQRAIELSRALPAAGPDKTVLPRLYVRAIDALEVSGDRDRARVLAEEAHHRFAGHPDPATAAAICHRTASLRGIGIAVVRIMHPEPRRQCRPPQRRHPAGGCKRISTKHRAS